MHKDGERQGLHFPSPLEKVQMATLRENIRLTTPMLSQGVGHRMSCFGIDFCLKLSNVRKGEGFA